MINQELLGFIRIQLSKGLNRETITKELLSGGWSEQDVQEGFSAISVNANSYVTQKIPIPTTNSSTVNNVQQADHKRGLFKKILRTILFSWIGFELFNLGIFIYLGNISSYRPFIIQIIQSTSQFK